jgi:hypothetical protein
MVAETFSDIDEEVQALPANYGEYYSNTDWWAQRIDEKCLMALYTTSGANTSTGLALYEEAVRTNDVVPVPHGQEGRRASSPSPPPDGVCRIGGSRRKTHVGGKTNKC